MFEKIAEMNNCLYEKVKDFLQKQAFQPETTYSLSGRLYMSDTGYLLLSVPNAVVRGLFDALDEHGIELPVKENGTLNAHISVMRPEEVEKIGGPDKITERGHSYKYNLGAVKCVKPAGGMFSKVWYVVVNSPDLQALRRTYGLASLPKENKHEFHITLAVRKTKVMSNNSVAKHVK